MWQPPILHYKNYHSQPVIVKMASLFVAQYELATLADDTATSLPYSTYSLSSTLAKRVRDLPGRGRTMTALPFPPPARLP